MAPIIANALIAARPALPVIAQGAMTGARLLGLGATIGAAYAVGFWSFGRTLRVLNRIEGRKASSTIDAVDQVAESNGDAVRGLTAQAA